MAPPASTAISPVVSLVVRGFTFLCLLISLIVLASNKITTGEVTIKFNIFYAYRYMLASTVIGMAYTLLLAVSSIFQISSGSRLGGDGFTYVEFLGDKVLSYMLATGAAAGFGLTVDVNRITGTVTETQDFLEKANAAAGVLLIAFICSAISSVFSSLSLPKRVQT